jgi:nucleotide-binding universal stress UspA family protein
MACVPIPASSSQTYPNFQNILFATDFSACSEAAVPYAKAIARLYGSTVHLVHVIGPEPVIGPLEVPFLDVETHRKLAAQRMEKLATCEAFKQILHTVTLQRGCVAKVISELVSALHADLIVLGTHGRRGLKHFVLGSVAEQIFRSAACPVLTVGPDVLKDGLAARRIGAILYATDFSPGSHNAFDYALSLARANGAKLTLFHAIESDVLLSCEEEAVSIVKCRLGKLMPENPGISYDTVGEFGSATDMILKAAKNSSADLIVMGARKDARPVAHMPWATAHRVVCYAACPVLTVRE